MTSTNPLHASPAPTAMLSVEEVRAYLLDRARRIEENKRLAVEDALVRIRFAV